MPIKAQELKDLDLPEIRQRLVEAEEELLRVARSVR